MFAAPEEEAQLEDHVPKFIPEGTECNPASSGTVGSPHPNGSLSLLQGGSGSWEMETKQWVLLATCTALFFYISCVLLPLALYLTEQSKYLCCISVHLLVFGSLLCRGACVRTGWGIRSNVSVEVKAAAGE